MNTMAQEMIVIWGIVKALYGDTTMMNAVLNTTTWVYTAQKDSIVNALALAIYTVANPATPGWLVTLTAARKKTLYDQAQTNLKLAQDAFVAAYGAIHTIEVALP